MAFREQGCKRLPGSAREQFFEALGSGLSPTAAATLAGVAGATGRKWAKDAGYLINTKHRGLRYSAAVREAFGRRCGREHHRRSRGDRRCVGERRPVLGATGWLCAQALSGW